MILQSCPHCARQYEVSHLEPGCRVRCVCDEDFSVAHVRDLRVRGRRCSNCGGSVASSDVDCTYCGAALDARELTSIPCPSCFARMDEDSTHCKGCGLKLAPQSLPPIPAGKGCPRCDGALQIRSLETACLIECSRCHGLWLDPPVFQDICRDAREERGTMFGSTEKEPPRACESTLGYIPCLDCGELMLRRQFRHRTRPTGVVLDYCRDHGVWLDGTELERIVRSIRAGSANAPDVELIEQAFRPRLEVRKLPERMVSREPETFSLRELLHAIADIFG